MAALGEGKRGGPKRPLPRGVIPSFRARECGERRRTSRGLRGAEPCFVMRAVCANHSNQRRCLLRKTLEKKEGRELTWFLSMMSFR